MNILLIGSGAREHALANVLTQDAQHELFCLASNNNPGILAVAKNLTIGKITDPQAVCDFAKEHAIDFAVIGPEAPLEVGVVDALRDMNIPAIGPDKNHAQIEASKGFTRDLMREYSIPGQPAYQRFENYSDQVDAFLHSLGGDYVIKADGLCGGKGVVVSGDHLNGLEEGVAHCQSLNGPFVIEEKLVGPEFSLISLSDGEHLAHTPAVQDHKRAFVGDKGPNTGGMGSYSDANHSLPFLTEEDIAQAHHINDLTIKALKAKFGTPYKGVLYGGFMKTANGVKLIEYNARFGDPEAMNLLGLLDSDFVAACQAMIDSNLTQDHLQFKPFASVCKYIVPEGYPTQSVKGEAVNVDAVDNPQALYFAAIDQQGDALIMTGSRAIAVLGIGATINEAEQEAERNAQQINGRVFYREDIGTDALIRERIKAVS